MHTPVTIESCVCMCVCTVHPEFAVDVDSGKNLIAIIHSSNTPVVHAKITLTSLNTQVQVSRSAPPTPMTGGLFTPGSHQSLRSTVGNYQSSNQLYLILTTADTSGVMNIHSAHIRTCHH
jgi:hypothetical protein